MLEFIRKYQSYIYLMVTIVIVISFSFFGTYNSIVTNPVRDQVVFTAVDGEAVRRNELDEMVMFISTDNFDKQLYHGLWGPNFLNNGVIREDLLKTGLANLLVSAYSNDLNQELEVKFQKEQAYRPYTHPQVKFISQESIWSTYAPKINQSFQKFISQTKGSPDTIFPLKVDLFVSEMEFPSYYSRYFLESQEKQYKFVTHDPNLDRKDLSLFGYRTVEDWFGPRFVRLSAQFIMNAAKIAEEKGYLVTNEEVLADLLRNSRISYQQNLNNPNIGVVNPQEYFNEQLRILGMDQSQAVKIWSQVLLFRKLFHDVGNSVFVDNLLMKNMTDLANQSITVDEYQLPKEFQFSDYKKLQQFQVYLNQVAKLSEEDQKNLKLPETFLTPSLISRRANELVQKRYLVKVSEANKKSLVSKVSLREIWNFEVDNFDLLKEKFPELALKKSETREDRIKALDQLSDATRSKVDLFASKEIVESNPNWLNDALNQAKERTLTISLSKEGHSPIFQGLKKGEDLMKQLDAKEIGTEKLRFTADGENYYLITVLDKSPNEEILTFKEALNLNILDRLVDEKLKAHYEKNKDANGWKSFDESKNAVADDFFKDLLNAIALKAPLNGNKTGDALAPYRFYGLMQEWLDQLKKDPEGFKQYVRDETSDKDETKLPKRETLQDQFKLIKKEVVINHVQEKENEALMKLPVNSFSDVLKNGRSELAFYFVKGQGNLLQDLNFYEKVKPIQSLVSNEAQVHFMKDVIDQIKEKKAISLDYLSEPIETMDPEMPSTPDMS